MCSAEAAGAGVAGGAAWGPGGAEGGAWSLTPWPGQASPTDGEPHLPPPALCQP